MLREQDESVFVQLRKEDVFGSLKLLVKFGIHVIYTLEKA